MPGCFVRQEAALLYCGRITAGRLEALGERFEGSRYLPSWAAGPDDDTRPPALLLLPAGLLAFFALPGSVGVPLALFCFAGLTAAVPLAALLALLALIPLHFVLRRPLGPVELSVPEISLLGAVLGLVAAWYWTALLRGRSALALPLRRAVHSPYFWSALLLLVVATVSLLFPTQYRRERLFVGLRQYSLLVEPVAVYVLVVTCLRDRRRLWLALDVLFLSAMAVTLFGLGQALWYAVAPPESIGGYYRATSLFNHPNTFALYLSRVLPLYGMLALLLHGRGGRRLSYAGGAVLMAVALLLSGSRGGWLAVAASALFAAMLTRRFKWLLPAALAGASGLALLVLSGQNRLSDALTSGRGSADTRERLWRAAVDEIGKQPLRGAGLGNVGWMRRYIPRQRLVETELVDAHNLVLDLWSKMGFLAVVAVLWLLGRFYWLAWRGSRQGDDTTSAVLTALLCAMTAAIVHGLVDAFLFGLPLAVLFWFMLGMAEVVVPDAPTPGAAQRGTRTGDREVHSPATLSG